MKTHVRSKSGDVELTFSSFVSAKRFMDATIPDYEYEYCIELDDGTCSDWWPYSG